MNPEPELQPPLCEEHRLPMVWGETDFAYTENGIEVTVRHIPAWVCPYADDSAFPPGVTDDLIATVRKLVEVAKQAQASQSNLWEQEYLVRIAA